MSEDNNNSDPFDFDFNLLNAEDSSKDVPSSSFDLDNSFGDTAFSGEAGVSADNPYLSEKSALDDPSGIDAAETESVTEDFSAFSESPESDEEGEELPPIAADTEQAGKKKGFLGGLFGGKKEKTPKGKQAKEKKTTLSKEPKGKKEKKEKVVKEKKPLREWVPRDLETILCIAFSVFFLAVLLVFNIASLVTRGDSLMQTLCFMGAMNIMGLAAAAVPILFYKFPKERTLPNVMLGIAAIAVFISLQSAVIEFYRYSFIMTP